MPLNLDPNALTSARALTKTLVEGRASSHTLSQAKELLADLKQMGGRGAPRELGEVIQSLTNAISTSELAVNPLGGRTAKPPGSR